MSRVLVTGGKGFLGSNIVSGLLKEDHHVRILARKKTDVQIEENPSKAEIIWGDIRDKQIVDQAVKDIDIVIHTVSNFRKGGSDKKEAYDINVGGTNNLLESAYSQNVKQIIHCSTIGVHGTVLEVPATEETSFNPTDLYQETKLTAEKNVWEFYKKTGLPITVIRPISLFGPGDQRMLKLFSMIKKERFFIVGDGEVYFHPAYIDDVVQGFLLCMNNEKAFGEAFIIGGSEYTTINKLCSIIANELNVNPPRIKIPLFPVLALATFFEIICEPFNISPPLHRRRVSFFQNNRAFSIEKAKQILGYEPQFSLEEIVQMTIKEYQKEKWL